VSTLRKHPVVGLLLLIFVLVALVQQPARSAEAVSDAWDGIASGTSSFVESFFVFTDNLGEES
jgi:hypothetical protein